MAAVAVLGRGAELEEVAGFVRSVADGPRGLVIEGEAGAGKTALWQAALVPVAATTTVLVCRPVRSEMDLPYAGLGDLLGAVLDGVLVELPRPQRLALEVALRRDDGAAAATDHRAVAAGVLTVLGALARDRPLVLAVDDLPWLDRPSARAIGFAFRRLSAEPVGLLATARREDGPPEAPELADLLGDGRMRRLRLSPLSVGSIQRLLADRLDLQLPRTALLALHDGARGNPFLALELGRALVEVGTLPGPGEPLPVPGDLRALLVGRVNRIPESARAALLLIALAADAREEVLAGAHGPGWDAAVAIGRREGIIEVSGAGLRLAHPLLAAAVAGAASERERRGAHGRLARSVVDPVERARHLGLAASGPDRETADALEEGARVSVRRGAPDAAADLAELAVRLTPPERVEDLRRRYTLAGEARFSAGDSGRAVELFGHAEALATPGPERGEALWHLGRVHYQHDDLGASRALLEEAARESGDDIGLRAAIDHDLAYVCLAAADAAATLAHARTAADLAERAGAVQIRADALAQVAVAELLTGGGLRWDLMDQARSLEVWDPPRPALLRPTIAVAHALAWADRLDEARGRLAEAERELRDRGDVGALPFLWYHLAELDCWSGDWARARARAEEADHVATQTGQDGTRVLTSYAVGLLAAHRGEEEATRTAVTAGLEVSRTTGHVLGLGLNVGVLGFLELSLGHPDRAHALLGPLLAGARAGGFDEPATAWWLGDEVEALVSLGEHEEAGAVTDWIETRSRAIDHPTGLAVAARSRALLANAAGAVDDALAACDEALAHHDRALRPFPRGRTLLVKGQIARRARKWGLARTSLEAALEAFDRLGAGLWVDRARHDLARIGGRPTPPGGLSESERQVAELVASGRTNRDVAAELFVSPKTVSATLGRVYRKLGVTSRTEMADRLRRAAPPA